MAAATGVGFLFFYVAVITSFFLLGCSNSNHGIRALIQHAVERATGRRSRRDVRQKRNLHKHNKIYVCRWRGRARLPVTAPNPVDLRTMRSETRPPKCIENMQGFSNGSYGRSWATFERRWLRIRVATTLLVQL